MAHSAGARSAVSLPFTSFKVSCRPTSKTHTWLSQHGFLSHQDPTWLASVCRDPYIIHLNIVLQVVGSLYFGGKSGMFQMGRLYLRSPLGFPSRATPKRPQLTRRAPPGAQHPAKMVSKPGRPPEPTAKTKEAMRQHKKPPGVGPQV